MATMREREQTSFLHNADLQSLTKHHTNVVDSHSALHVLSLEAQIARIKPSPGLVQVELQLHYHSLLFWERLMRNAS